MRYTPHHMLAWALLVGMACSGCNDPPPPNDQTPLYRAPGDEGPTSGERGSILINEIHWAGSVTNDGTHDWDDVFIELKSQEERPVNPSNWRLMIRGDHSATYQIPEVDEPIEPNEYFVIASQPDGAFGKAADVVIEDLELGRGHTYVKLTDADERLMDSAGSKSKRNFAGAWDTVTARSMERVQLIFANTGTVARSWHSYSSRTGLDTIAEGYRRFTLASPGAANSTDYSGSTASGSFE